MFYIFFTVKNTLFIDTKANSMIVVFISYAQLGEKYKNLSNHPKILPSSVQYCSMSVGVPDPLFKDFLKYTYVYKIKKLIFI